VGPGFSSEELAVLALGVGDVLAYGINASRVRVTATGWAAWLVCLAAGSGPVQGRLLAAGDKCG
jgi:hypothetical protein